jgi:predicted permease
MLLYAFPGFLLARTRLVKKEAVSAFAILLVYVCQPCLSVYAFKGVEFTGAFVSRMLIFAALMLLALGTMMGGAYLMLRKKQIEPRYRIATIACALGNFTFMGIPIIESLIPGASEEKVYATIAFLVSSCLSWTVGNAIIARDLKYCRIAKIFLNPGTIGVAVAVILSVAHIELPAILSDAIDLVGRMATPVCMLVMGMRLGFMKLKSLFTKPTVYLSIGIKQIIMPLVGLLITLVLPLPYMMKLTFYVMCCTPVASNVQNFAEMIGEGMEEAANTVLLGTILSVATLPLMMFLAP